MEETNPAIREIYSVEYHVIIGEGFGERINDSFEYEGPEPSRDTIWQGIASRQTELDWNTPRKITYTVSRLMNNNTHIVAEQGEFNPEDWSGTAAQPAAGYTDLTGTNM